MIGASPIGAFPVGARAFLYTLTEEIPETPDPVEGGTFTVTRTTAGKLTKLAFAWTADADGEVEDTTTFSVTGRVESVRFTPGTPTPDAGYDLWLFDADRHDVLLGQGVNRSASSSEVVTRANLGAIAGSTLTLAVRNAGDSAQGSLVLTVR